MLAMPSCMILNIESIVGYSKKLKQATQWMNLGVNNDVNQGTKIASLRPIDGGASKINPPISHPSNPIHKHATQVQGLGETKKVNKEKSSVAPEAYTQTSSMTTLGDDAPETDKIEPHHVNKAIAAVGAIVLAGFILWMR